MRAMSRGVTRMPSYAMDIGLLSLLLFAFANGWAHAYLVKSVPARRAMLSQAPARVQLWFNERLEARFSHLAVWDVEDKQVDNRDVQVGADDPKKLSVGIPTLLSGAYIVKYRVLSVDGHIVEGQFPFTLRGSP